MSQSVKNTDELGARSRENRRFTTGRVISVDTLQHKARVDVGASLPDGTVKYLEDVPFSPQSPPAVGATVLLAYNGTSNHSVYITTNGVGGPNSQSTVTTVGNAGDATPKEISVGGPPVVGVATKSLREDDILAVRYASLAKFGL